MGRMEFALFSVKSVLIRRSHKAVAQLETPYDI